MASHPVLVRALPGEAARLCGTGASGLPASIQASFCLWLCVVNQSHGTGFAAVMVARAVRESSCAHVRELWLSTRTLILRHRLSGLLRASASGRAWQDQRNSLSTRGARDHDHAVRSLTVRHSADPMRGRHSIVTST